MHAIRVECGGVTQFLIESGADVNARSNYGRTAIFNAAGSGPLSLVKRLIAGGARADIASSFGDTALSFAQNVEIAKALVEAGADVNAAENNGLTPLMHAVMSCDREKIIYLLGKGANVDARNELGVTALGFAMCGYAEVIDPLLAAGADINAQDNKGRTPLMMTIGYPETTALFIKAGANVNIKDKNGQTALDYAMKSDTFREEIVKIVKKAGGVAGNARTGKKSLD
jgi:ankyrin repeat protein